jgi:hypothetical protein
VLKIFFASATSFARRFAMMALQITGLYLASVVPGFQPGNMAFGKLSHPDFARKRWLGWVPGNKRPPPAAVEQLFSLS